ncbi:MAG: hypothetical protein M1825_000385 [Sarcosagium campestre]|nr:MAG: hypothetical protein M1825_000385 [Sarcosagium campestre]
MMQTESQNAVDARVERLWRTLDIRKEGHLDLDALKKGLQKLDHPLQNADDLLGDVMKAVDTNSDGRIEYEEFRVFVEETEKELRVLFNSIDRDHNGKLDKNELNAAFQRAGLAVSKSKLDKFFGEVDTNNDGVISFDEWRDFLLFLPNNSPGLKAVLSYYSSTVSMNQEGDVQVSRESGQGLGIAPKFPSTFFEAILSIAYGRTRHNPRKYYSEEALYQEVSPEILPDPPGETYPSEDRVSMIEESNPFRPPARWISFKYWKQKLMDLHLDAGYFLAGGVAGVVSRTATAPLDRLRVYLIAQTSSKTDAIQSVKNGEAVQAAKVVSRPLVVAIKALWRAGGIRSLFAGNGLNVVKVMPESAIKFGSYEGAKRAFAQLEGHGDPFKINGYSQFASGGIAGMVSQFFVYPVDTLKFRMQCETVEGGLRGNRLIIDTAIKMWKNNGFKAYYRGLPMGLAGMFPYAAIDLATFEALKRSVTARNARTRGCHKDDAAPGSIITASIGAISGAFGSTVVYPVNLLRTRLQAQGTAIHPQTYTGVMDVTRKTIKNEGFRGLFKGLTPNLFKVVPAVSITYVTYEKCKHLLALK